MANRIVLIPIVRVESTRQTVIKALDALLMVGEIDIDEDSLDVDVDGRYHVVIVNGDEDEVTVASVAAYIKGWFDARGVKASIL